MRTFNVKMIWESGVWHTSTGGPLHLTLESESYDGLLERVLIAAPEMVELNIGYTGPIKLVFTSEREETLAEAV